MPPIVLSVLFYLLATMLIVMALIVVTSANVFHSAIALTCTLAVSAGLFALLGADFLAVGQLLVYVGGVMIIMLFVVMLSQKPQRAPRSGSNGQWIAGLALAGVIGGYLVVLYRQYFSGVTKMGTMMPTSVSIGRLLMNEMLIPFEAVSLVLLVALVGAVVFGQDGKADAS
jgi:NADH:ubiquinone oxidoreductase subunit 6 (subunit J)